MARNQVKYWWAHSWRKRQRKFIQFWVESDCSESLVAWVQRLSKYTGSLVQPLSPDQPFLASIIGKVLWDQNVCLLFWFWVRWQPFFWRGYLSKGGRTADSQIKTSGSETKCTGLSDSTIGSGLKPIEITGIDEGDIDSSYTVCLEHGSLDENSRQKVRDWYLSLRERHLRAQDTSLLGLLCADRRISGELDPDPGRYPGLQRVPWVNIRLSSPYKFVIQQCPHPSFSSVRVNHIGNRIIELFCLR